MARHVVKFHMIAEFFRDDHKRLQRSENAFTSGNVKQIKFTSNGTSILLKGQVHASMKNKLYTVETEIDLKKGVQKSECTCPRGASICHHMGALMYYAHYNLSSTDLGRQWGTFKGEATDTTVKTVQELYPPKEMYEATYDVLSEDTIQEFRNRLDNAHVVGFSWLLRPEIADDVHQLIPPIEDIIQSEDFLNAEVKENVFIQMCELTHQEILNIADVTIGQHANEAWQVTRKYRLTASKFGLVIKACRRNKYPPSLFKSLMEGYDLHRVLAVQWGKNNGKEGLKCFSNSTNIKVVPTGLWLDECGYLGASPDGLIDDDSIIEVKCPFKFRKSSIREAVEDGKYLFTYRGENIVINCDHDYYHQIQGQLYITKRQKCYFVVWTTVDFETVLIKKDDDWAINLDRLKTFYLEKYLTALLNTHL